MGSTIRNQNNTNIEMTEMLLSYVDRLGSYKVFWLRTVRGKNDGMRGRGRSGGRDQRDRGIGSSGIRNLASMALNAECYKEFRLFIEYKKGKGNGWNDIYEKDKVFADIVLEYMDEIYEKCNRDDKETLRQISRLFGYLFWKVKSIAG